MSLTDDYLKARSQRLGESPSSGARGSSGTLSGGTKGSSGTVSSGAKGSNSLTNDFLQARSARRKKEREEELRRMAAIQAQAEEENEDIAPVSEKWWQGWFRKGEFEDGYDFGDISRTILGTATDVLEDIGTGILGMGEKIVDAGAYLAPYQLDEMNQYIDWTDPNQVAKLEEMKEEARRDSTEFIKRNLYDEAAVARSIITNPVEGLTGIGVENASVLDRKMDSTMQSGGQLLAQAGLQAVGVPWFLTSTATSFGSETEAALNEGASYEEAGISAGITAAAEVLTEQISGGIRFGGKTLDDVLITPLARGISNKFTRNLLKVGMDFGGEGLEEVLSSGISRFGKWLTYQDDQTLREILFSEEAASEYIEAFIGGAFMGGGMGTFNAVRSHTKGADYVSGLTDTEKAVVDAVYQSRLREEGEISERDKNNLYDRVLEDLEKGYISTTEIESVLGGDTYKNYRNTVDNEEAILSEYEELGKKQNPTLAETARYNELTSLVADIRKGESRSALADQLRQETMGIVKGTRLMESYNERFRRGQAFQADLSQYNQNQRQTIQRAIDSGILNNTRRTHEFVDMISKISADKGVLFDFTNNAKLKESGFAIDGKQVNGFVTKDGITLNIDSHKALQSTVGHEVTHVLEGTELYSELQQRIFQYAESKGELRRRRLALQELYKSVEGANIDAELTADLVGEYIFGDEGFVRNLSTNHRSVFEKIYDEIKYFCRVATTGSREARELEKVKRAFEKAYRGAVEGLTDTKYSMSEEYSDMIDSDGEVLTVAQKSYFDEDGLKDDNGNLLKLYRSADGGRTVWNGRGSDSTAEGIYLTDDVYVARAFASDGKRVGDVLEVYANASNPLVIDAHGSNYMDIPMPENAPEWLEDSGDWEGRLNADKLPITAFANGHDAVIIKNVREGVGGEPATDVILRDSNQMKRTDNKNPTADPDIRYSLSADSEGRTLSAAVSKRFENSRVVDENGSLKVVYHGTASGEFSIFDKAKGSVEGDFGSGFYFTDNEADVSEHYEGGGPDFENKVARLAEQIESDEDIDYEEAEERARAELYKGSHKFEVYLNIENPAIVGETMLFDSDFGDRYNEEDFDDYDEYIAETEQAIADAVDEIVWEVEKNADLYSTDGLADVIYEAYYDGGIHIEDLKHKLNELYLEDSNGNLVSNEVARQIIESLGYDGIIDPTVSGKWNMDIEEGTTHYIVFKPNQIKAVTNQSPTDNPDIHRSLSPAGRQAVRPNYRAIMGEDIALESKPTAEDSKVVAENETTTPTVSKTETFGVAPVTAADMQEMFPDNAAPVQEELERLDAHKRQLYGALEMAVEHGSANEVGQLAEEYEGVNSRIKALEQEEAERTRSLADSDAPPEIDAPYYGENQDVTVDNPFEDRDWYGVSNRSVKAYMYENPEVKPFFQAEAQALLGELNDTIKGERFFNDDVYYESGGERGFSGVKRLTSDSIATLLDSWHMSYADIEKGLNAIIEDNGAENIAAAKKIEFMLNDRLLNGYNDFYSNGRIEPNQEYINLLNERQINSYSQEAFDNFMQTADSYAPEDVAPVKPLAKATPDTVDAPIFESRDKNTVKGQTTMFEPPKPNPRVANVLTQESAIAKEKPGIGGKIVSALVDKGMVFENLSLKTGNHELQAKWNYTLPSHTEARAQHFMENGAKGVKPLKDIKKTVDKSGKADTFFEYLYHVHNIDRMTLADRFGVENKTVFGETVTAEVSRRKVVQYEKANPEFKSWANDIYAYNRHLRNMLVGGNIISQKTADLWEKMYPHYVPIRRVDSNGQNISVPLDTNKTGVNNPVKRATGGSSDIQPVFSTMAQRTEQVYRAIARNAFGIELKNTLGTTINSEKNTAGVDETVDTLVAQEDHLLKPGSMSSNPTFTVFENGERVEFEITEDMFDALKPAGKILGYRNRVIGAIGEGRRNLLTQWNPVFALYRNPIKDIQDVAVNSQHPVKTYANVPNAIFQIATGGRWAEEYHQNGGKSNTYFDSRTNKFKADDNVFKKTIGMPLKALETAGEFIEEIPRLAEYIASRQDGRSVERSMLDAARVTTNFAAGGDFTKFLNSHGFTFLNASVQGAAQHARNFREAKQQGLKGYVKVLAKYTAAGLPGILLNNLLWDDDEEYEELNDYVKQNYYVVAKTEDGRFIRIPKGRTAAVMQNAFEQMEHLITGDDEADFGTFFELFMNNIAPNNPLENNILAPVFQTLNNKAWYGGDLVPSRLQKLPAEEQFDESTDAFSRWLGEHTGTSPYKWNYLIDQYSGGLGDVFLPMLTPEAESGDNSLWGNILAPWKKELSTDSVLNNRNPGDFYDLRDELEVQANSRNATEEDRMRSLYMDTVSWEMSDLYAQKREIQSSDLPDDEKYEAVREIQEQINQLANNALNNYNRVNISGSYAEVGDRRYNQDAESGKWYEIKPKNADGTDNWYYQMEQEVTQGLGISYEEYWNNREEYNFAYEKPGEYALANSCGGYGAYMEYRNAFYDIKADKDSDGNSINGTRKPKVVDYINSLDIDYGMRLILFKSQYNADDTYNNEIIEYLNGRDDISYAEMETILKELGFEVDSEGYITWD